MNIKAAYQKLEQDNRDLSYKYENEKARIKGLEDQLQRLQSEKFEIERNLTAEIQRLKYELNEQRNSFSNIREQEINALNQKINQLTTEKQQVEAQLNNLYNEYQNINQMSAGQNQYLDSLKAKEKQHEEERKYYKTVYDNIAAEKDNLQAEATNIINQKDQFIQQLTNEINQLKQQQQQQQQQQYQIVAKPEEVKLEIKPEQPRINPQKYMIQEPVSQGTRSHGPVEQGGFIETQVHDSSGNLESIDFKYRLQTGNEYQPKNFFINLLLPDRGQVQQFKLEFRNTYTQGSFTKPEDYSKFVEEELNIHFQNRAELVVAAMKNIIDSESRVNASFKKLYEDKARA